MNYPLWDPPLLGGGLLIGIIAILHVFVAHFAVGGGLFLVLTERRAAAENDPGLLEFARRHSRFFIRIVLVLGAVTGVGIWWAIGLVHPAATSALIHTFLWVWAIEWALFAIEIAAAFVYYHGWDRLDRRTHLTVGWIYFAAAWLSLAAVNGILTFMLTPGGWLDTRSLADAFFNPTMLPSLVVRTASAIALGGLYALLTASAIPDEPLRHRVTRHAARWVLVGCAILPLGGAWYIALLPPLAQEISMGGAPAVTLFAGLSILLSGVIVALTFFGPYLRPQTSNVVLAAVLAALGLAVTGVTEWTREAVRKPYVIYGYMYSNGLRPEDEARLAREGALASARWHDTDTPLRKGYALFQTQCRNCHTIDGYNAIRPLVKGWREEFIEFQLRHLNELKGFMPPFMGTDAERAALAHWLYEIGRRRPFEPVEGAR
jgi:mono/diheme cytochrome c family protein